MYVYVLVIVVVVVVVVVLVLVTTGLDGSRLLLAASGRKEGRVFLRETKKRKSFN